MAKITLIAPTTDAVSNIEFDTSKVKSDTLTIIADTLAASEEVDLEIYAGNDTFKVWETNTGTVDKLTATQYMLSLPNPGCMIRVSKDATGGACGVVISWPESTKRGG